MKTKIQIFMILGAVFFSCSVTRLQTDNSYQRYPVTNFENIEVYSTDKIEKEYAVIGEVIASVETLSDEAAVSVKYLKKQAAKLGADGIINLKLEFGYGFLSNSITATGVAVKFTN